MGQQIWATNSLGGFLSNDTLSAKIRHAAQPMMKFRQFTDPASAMGQSKGQLFLFDKISNVQTQGGTLTETSPIPKTNFTITQGSLTLREYGNSVPYTNFAQLLAESDLPSHIEQALMDDMAKVLDSAAATEFQASDYKATITNTSTTTFGSAGVALETAGANMSDVNVRDIVDQMKILNIPKWDGVNYIAVCSTKALRGVYDFFEAKSVNTTMENAMMGEVGRYYMTRFVEETNVLSNSIGSGSQYGEAVFFGQDAVKEAIALPEELRIDANDFGRDKGIAWLSVIGFSKIWDFSTDGETRIIHVTSL